MTLDEVKQAGRFAWHDHCSDEVLDTGRPLSRPASFQGRRRPRRSGVSDGAGARGASGLGRGGGAARVGNLTRLLSRYRNGSRSETAS